MYRGSIVGKKQGEVLPDIFTDTMQKTFPDTVGGAVAYPDTKEIVVIQEGGIDVNTFNEIQSQVLVLHPS
jgi:hypothetical protein